MITDIHREFINDISMPDNVIQFGIRPTLTLSAEVLTKPSRGSVKGARLELLRYTCTQLLIANPVWRFWLMTAHRAIQRDNRIARYYRLWRSVGVPFKEKSDYEEGIRTHSEGIRFFGARTFDVDELDSVNQILRTERGVIVIGDRNQLDSTISTLSRNGWEVADVPAPVDIVNSVCPKGGIVCPVFGEFDDKDVSVALIGRKDILDRVDSFKVHYKQS